MSETCAILNRQDFKWTESAAFHIGFAQTQGRRSNMEDVIMVVGHYRNNPDEDLIGVFDGFRGINVAKMASERFPVILEEELKAAEAEYHRLRGQGLEDNTSESCSLTDDNHDDDDDDGNYGLIDQNFEGIEETSPKKASKPLTPTQSPSRPSALRTPVSIQTDDSAPRSPSISIRSVAPKTQELAGSHSRSSPFHGSLLGSSHHSSLSRSPFHGGVPSISIKKNISETISGDYQIIGRHYFALGEKKSILSSHISRNPNCSPDHERDTFYVTSIDSEVLTEKTQQHSSHVDTTPLLITLYGLALRRTFWRIQEQINKSLNDGGSTGLVIYRNKSILMVANAGDTRAIMRNRNERFPFRLSKDHKPGDSSEQSRIEKNGGSVSTVAGSVPRVSGEISVSRAFGTSHHDLVIPEPHIHARYLHESDEFILMATDGLWDKLYDSTASMMGSDFLSKPEGRSMQETIFNACDGLVKESFSKQSTDNISVIMLVPKPSQSA